MRCFILFAIILFSCQGSRKESSEDPEYQASLMSIEKDDEPKIYNSYALHIYRESKTVLIDTIVSVLGEIEYLDFNLDGTNDILVQNSSDVRSNLTYYLYLIDPVKGSPQKVQGFNEVKNPKINETHPNIIESYVVSGTDYYEFYEFLGSDSIFKHSITLYDDHSDSSNQVYLETIDSLSRVNQ